MKEYLRIYGLGLLLIVAGFVLTYQFVKPSPPRTLTIATGSESGAYYAYAQRYKELLAKQGIELNILNTAGSVENINKVKRGEADIAFVQSGIGQPYKNDVTDEQQTLVALASVYYEPLWLFMPSSQVSVKVNDLRGKRIAIGAEGSGTNALAKTLLSDNGIDISNSTLFEIDSDDAAKRIKAGELDYLFLVASVNAPLVQQLLADTSIVPFDFARAKAYTRRYRFLSAVELPQGVVDFSQNIPDKDIDMLTAAATLVTHEDLHPALIALLMQAAEEVHGGGDLLGEAGQFPSKLFVDFSLDASAERYFNYGPPLLQRYLPFWAAVLVNQLKVFLIPIIALMIPLMRILPPLYRWRVRSRIYRWYRDLREIEDKLSGELSSEERLSLATELDALQQDVMQQPAPLSYTDELYHLRGHIKLVKDRVEGHPATGQ
ncbi:MAG: TAXI family TRAP transporter solute-binding subunit [Rickettsiales bacterium]|nr:TAXI family TRAP transporter solute-binding subunit [Rickettsiales bacterium]